MLNKQESDIEEMEKLFGVDLKKEGKNNKENELRKKEDGDNINAQCNVKENTGIKSSPVSFNIQSVER
ncbi:hypothetical protein LWI28_017155 [Acer negundo]|uniref:Uncharacterized protein n=1 Tax=Acer negundo TaxID=4023 RepID=A0AAD5IZK4_ACENE|nr:hypothetical protein LWI28_017155 [Acer negundo]